MPVPVPRRPKRPTSANTHQTTTCNNTVPTFWTHVLPFWQVAAVSALKSSLAATCPPTDCKFWHHWLWTLASCPWNTTSENRQWLHVCKQHNRFCQPIYFIWNKIFSLSLYLNFCCLSRRFLSANCFSLKDFLPWALILCFIMEKFFFLAFTLFVVLANSLILDFLLPNFSRPSRPRTKNVLQYYARRLSSVNGQYRSSTCHQPIVKLSICHQPIVKLSICHQPIVKLSICP